MGIHKSLEFPAFNSSGVYSDVELLDWLSFEFSTQQVSTVWKQPGRKSSVLGKEIHCPWIAGVSFTGSHNPSQTWAVLGVKHILWVVHNPTASCSPNSSICLHLCFLMKSFFYESCLWKFLKDLEWVVLINKDRNIAWQSLWLTTSFFSCLCSLPSFSSTFRFSFVSQSFSANCCLAQRSQIQRGQTLVAVCFFLLLVPASHPTWTDLPNFLDFLEEVSILSACLHMYTKPVII